MYLKALLSALYIKKDFFDDEDGEALKEVVQADAGCPIPGNIQDWDGWGSEHPDLVPDVPAHCREVQTRLPLKVPSNPKHSMPVALKYRIFGWTWLN